jgi:hypothetical protein
MSSPTLFGYGTFVPPREAVTDKPLSTYFGAPQMDDFINAIHDTGIQDRMFLVMSLEHNDALKCGRVLSCYRTQDNGMGAVFQVTDSNVARQVWDKARANQEQGKPLLGLSPHHDLSVLLNKQHPEDSKILDRSMFHVSLVDQPAHGEFGTWVKHMSFDPIEFYDRFGQYVSQGDVSYMHPDERKALELLHKRTHLADAYSDGKWRDHNRVNDDTSQWVHYYTAYDDTQIQEEMRVDQSSDLARHLKELAPALPEKYAPDSIRHMMMHEANIPIRMPFQASSSSSSGAALPQNQPHQQEEEHHHTTTNKSASPSSAENATPSSAMLEDQHHHQHEETSSSMAAVPTATTPVAAVDHDKMDVDTPPVAGISGAPAAAAPATTSAPVAAGAVTDQQGLPTTAAAAAATLTANTPGSFDSGDNAAQGGKKRAAPDQEPEGVPDAKKQMNEPTEVRMSREDYEKMMNDLKQTRAVMDRLHLNRVKEALQKMRSGGVDEELIEFYADLLGKAIDGEEADKAFKTAEKITIASVASRNGMQATPVKYVPSQPEQERNFQAMFQQNVHAVSQKTGVPIAVDVSSSSSSATATPAAGNNNTMTDQLSHLGVRPVGISVTEVEQRFPAQPQPVLVKYESASSFHGMNTPNPYAAALQEFRRGSSSSSSTSQESATPQQHSQQQQQQQHSQSTQSQQSSSHGGNNNGSIADTYANYMDTAAHIIHRLSSIKLKPVEDLETFSAQFAMKTRQWTDVDQRHSGLLRTERYVQYPDVPGFLTRNPSVKSK